MWCRGRLCNNTALCITFLSLFFQLLELIQEAILATDLALFFGNKAKLEEIIASNSFNWENEEHRSEKTQNNCLIAHEKNKQYIYIYVYSCLQTF